HGAIWRVDAQLGLGEGLPRVAPEEGREQRRGAEQRDGREGGHLPREWPLRPLLLEVVDALAADARRRHVLAPCSAERLRVLGEGGRGGDADQGEREGAEHRGTLTWVKRPLA